MKNLSLKRYVVFGLLITFGAAGILSGCGKKEYPQESVEPVEQDFSMEEESQQENDEADGQSFSIGEELQWASDFGWQYFSLAESADGEIAGCFKTSDLQDGDTIEVYHDVLSEEALFALINSQAKDLKERYPEGQVVWRMNGSTEIDQFVQLDTETMHWLYLRMNDSVYILYTEMERENWKDFLEEWLFTSGLQWNGAAVLEESGSVEDTFDYTNNYKVKGLWNYFQYGENCTEIDGDILLFHRQEDGFYFKLEWGSEENRFVEEVVLRSSDIDLDYDSWEEAVSYFADRYPDMYSLEAYLYGGDTRWNFDGKMSDSVFFRVEKPEGSHGFFVQNGKVCEVISQEEKPSCDNMVDTIRRNAGYDYDACFLWEQEEDGSIIYEDNLEGKFSYVKDLGSEKIVRIRAEIVEKEEGESGDIFTYKVEIVDEKENKFIQELQVNSERFHRSPFRFEDFNADGYQDLSVEQYYGAVHGMASHYIFSPSKEKFVKLDSEFDYYLACNGVNYETRRFYMHYRDSAISGTEITYQWKNEMDYEMIRKFVHDNFSVDDGVQVTITRYENGKEETLSDYLYSLEEYDERLNDIWGTYYEDFIWEKEVTDQTTGKKYTIRYAEVFRSEEAEKNYGSYYDGRIYVFDEDTYLVSVTYSERASQSESIEWEDGDGDTEQMLEIHYPDGGYSGYPLSVLIVPDYEG